MRARKVTEQDILGELKDLAPAKWTEVLDFIGYLKQQSLLAGERPMTAGELSQSELVGMWSDRDECADALSFARRLRWEAEL